MKVYNIAVLEGDGIGPEVMKEALKLLEVISKTVSYTHLRAHET